MNRRARGAAKIGDQQASGGMLVHWMLVVAVVPLVAAGLVCTFRDPLGFGMPIYAATVPFGSGVSLPGIPQPYGSLSSVTGLILIMALASRLGSQRIGPRAVAIAVPIWLLLLGLAGMSIFWSLRPGKTASSTFVLAAFVIMYALVRTSKVHPTVIRRVEVAVLVGAVCVAGVGLFQLLTGHMATGATDNRLGRAMLEPNHTAAAMILPLVVGLHRLQRSVTAPAALGNLAAAVSAATALILTGSRGGALAATFAVLVLLFLGRSRTQLLLILSAGVVLVSSLFVITPLEVPRRLERETSSGRTDIWRVGIRACPDFCLEGSGWGTFGDVYRLTLPATEQAQAIARGTAFEPHNVMLLVVIELGAGGLVLFILGVALVLRETLALPTGVRGPPTAALLGLLASGVFLSNLEFKYFWMTLMYVALVAQSGIGGDPIRRVQAPQSSAGVRPSWGAR